MLEAAAGSCCAPWKAASSSGSGRGRPGRAGDAGPAAGEDRPDPGGARRPRQRRLRRHDQRAIYQGTDTAYHIALAGGGRLVVRDANREDGTAAFARGDMVAVALPVAALRILRD